MALTSNKTATSSEASKEKKEQTPTKVIIRRLPPTLTSEMFLEQVSPIPTHDYFCYFKADMSLGTNAFSRAYINFLSLDDLMVFTEKFDGYVFLDSKGNEYPAVVEFAPFQKVPKKRAKKADSRKGTIEQDPEYKTFLDKLENPDPEPLPTIESVLEEIEIREKEKKANPSARQTTPLIEYIKKRREEKRAMLMKVKEDRRRKDLERKKSRDEDRRRQKDVGHGRVTSSDKGHRDARKDDRRHSGGAGGTERERQQRQRGGSYSEKEKSADRDHPRNKDRDKDRDRDRDRDSKGRERETRNRDREKASKDRENKDTSRECRDTPREGRDTPREARPGPRESRDGDTMDRDNKDGRDRKTSGSDERKQRDDITVRVLRNPEREKQGKHVSKPPQRDLGTAPNTSQKPADERRSSASRDEKSGYRGNKSRDDINKPGNKRDEKRAGFHGKEEEKSGYQGIKDNKEIGKATVAKDASRSNKSESRGNRYDQRDTRTREDRQQGGGRSQPRPGSSSSTKSRDSRTDDAGSNPDGDRRTREAGTDKQQQGHRMTDKEPSPATDDSGANSQESSSKRDVDSGARSRDRKETDSAAARRTRNKDRPEREIYVPGRRRVETTDKKASNDKESLPKSSGEGNGDEEI